MHFGKASSNLGIHYMLEHFKFMSCILKLKSKLLENFETIHHIYCIMYFGKDLFNFQKQFVNKQSLNFHPKYGQGWVYFVFSCSCLLYPH
jgi:hypothetical protein